MTEQTLSSPAIQPESSGAESSISQTSGAEVQQQAAPQASPEKQIAQSDVGRIAGAIRKESHDKGYEKGYQEALSKFQQQAANAPAILSPVETANPQSTQQAQQPQSSVQMQQMIQQKIAEALQQREAEQHRLSEEKQMNDYLQQLGSQLRPKIDAAKEKYEDFDSAVQDLQLGKIPHVLEWVNSVPNAGEVLYDLAKNPHKLGVLNSLHTPELALRQIHAISQSLQNNESAQSKTMPREPLSSVQPSNVGKNAGAPTGQEVIEASRKKYRF